MAAVICRISEACTVSVFPVVKGHCQVASATGSQTATNCSRWITGHCCPQRANGWTGSCEETEWSLWSGWSRPWVLG